jgi:YD repeat-containing protein
MELSMKTLLQQYRGVASLAVLMGVLGLNAHADQSWDYTYNNLGLVETANGPRTDVNDTTTYTYDTSGNLTSVENALTQTTLLQDYNGRGQPGKIIDSNQVATILTYHARGWLASSTLKHPSGSAALDATTTYVYDNVGQLTTLTLPDGTVLNYEYDAAQRMTAISNGLSERIEYTLDDARNRTAEVIKDSTGNIRKTLTRAFDELSRVMDITGAAGQNTHFDYDAKGNQTLILKRVLAHHLFYDEEKVD